jgi:hypothetical protein
LKSSHDKAAKFLLSKWYLDCVSEEGSALICYAASLRWRSLSLSYSSVLRRQADGRAETCTTLQEFAPPEVNCSSVRWLSQGLKVEGKWDAVSQPVKQTLLESADGKIEWNCLQPRSRAEVRFGTGSGLKGLGYVEHLTMTIAPWRLPFDELRWGRFLSEEDALVWIGWSGAESFNLSFHNGTRIYNAAIAENKFAAGAMSVSLFENSVLREGALVKTALSMIPGINKLFPLRILQARECKWLSRGLLKQPDAEESRGWAIHEVVRWPKRNS